MILTLMAVLYKIELGYSFERNLIIYNYVISDKRRDLFLSHRLPGDL